MFEFDDSKLRARVEHDFELLAREYTDAQTMNRFSDAVVTTTVGTLRSLLNDANIRSAMGGIPSELLAACFAYLSFQDRIRASHVCRCWREAALSSPVLWSRIAPWPPFKGTELLQMALSRACGLPVDLKITARTYPEPQAMYTAIAPFSRQIQYLQWYCAQPTSPWNFPALNVEYLRFGSTVNITEGFLGGQMGALRYLYLQCVHLPPACPALSTVTDLSVVSSAFEDDAGPSSLGNLFDLFPRLEWLQILGISGGSSHTLPTGLAPSFLTELSLQCMSRDYDLIQHCLAWDCGSLRHVTLTLRHDTRPDLELLASGTITLAVNHSSNDSHTCLMFERAAGPSYTLNLTQIGISNAAALLSAAQATLSDVCTAIISHTALEPLAALLATMPRLEQLSVHITPSRERSHLGFDWAPLACLANTARGVAGLRGITLCVWCGYQLQPCFADEDDARGLIAQLRAVPGDLPPITIQGFPADEVSSIDLVGLGIRFDFSATVGELALWKPREEFYPFFGS